MKGGGAHLILQLEFCWKKPRILDLGGSSFKAFHYLFFKSFVSFFFISLKFTNLQSSLINIESIERFKVTADIISILIHNNIISKLCLIKYFIKYPCLPF